jgi:predicted amidophosphoribosyltransferase
MPLSKCPRCKKLFNKTDFPVCGDCRPDEERDHETVRAALEKNPDVGAERLSELSSIDIEVILRMLDQGIITNVAAGAAGVRCGRCGAPAISATKRLCEMCLAKLNQEMVEAQRAIKSKKHGRAAAGASDNVRDLLEEKRRS